MKKAAALIICAALLLFSAAADAGQEPVTEPDPHTHSLVYNAGYPASCEADGVVPHYICRGCGLTFSDPEGNEEISDASALILPATGHAWGEWEIVTQPTETEPGMRRRYCGNEPQPHVLVVTLDAGHGYYDNRGYYPEYYEGRRMFTLASYLADELGEYSNIIVCMTRNEITDDMLLSERGRTAVLNGSELFISIHSNWAESSEAMGVSVYRSFIRPESEELGVLLGEAVTETIKSVTGETYMRNDGAPMTRTEPAYGPECGDGITQDYYNVTRESVKSEKCRYSYIIEHGFHSNPAECEFLLSDENLAALAKAEADVIAGYFGLIRKGAEYVAERHVQYEEIPPVGCAGKGDVNGDGAINNKDVVTLFRYTSGDGEASVIEYALDVNGDGSVNNKDVVYLFAYLTESDAQPAETDPPATDTDPPAAGPDPAP